MISNHFPSTYGSGWNWLILTALALAGIVIRHYFNRRHLPGRHWGLMALGLAGLAAIILATAPRAPDRQAGADTPPVTLEAVNAVVEQRCAACHAAAPSFAGFTAPPRACAWTARRRSASTGTRSARWRCAPASCRRAT